MQARTSQCQVRNCYLQREEKLRENQKVLKEAKIEEDLHFYDLKHTRLSRLTASGASILLLKTISNHASSSSLERYVKNSALKEAALELLE